MFGWMRRVVAVLFVVGLAIGVVLLWPRSEPEEPSNTLAEATTTSTSLAGTTSSSEAPPSSTSSSEGGHVVETVEEAEEILRELWFGWFEGIYNQDEDRIREVVATRPFLEAGINAFGELAFTSQPSEDGISFQEVEVLKSTADCLAVWSVSNPEFLDVDEPRSGVEVLRFVNGWKFANSWKLRGDRWEGDCETELSPLG